MTTVIEFFEGVAAVYALGWAALWVWAVVDILRRDDLYWRATGHSEATSLGLMFLLGPFGALAHVLVVRPALIQAENKRATWKAGQAAQTAPERLAA